MITQDNNGREYRYQWDWNVPGGMCHVRCDDWEDFKEAKMNMESILPKTEAFPDDTGPHATSKDDTTQEPSWCPIHKVTMKKWEKNGRSWYSHKWDDGWCNGGKNHD